MTNFLTTGYAMIIIMQSIKLMQISIEQPKVFLSRKRIDVLKMSMHNCKSHRRYNKMLHLSSYHDVFIFIGTKV